jgi:hypothetical protein
MPVGLARPINYIVGQMGMIDDCEHLKAKHMAAIEWHPLPTLWPSPAIWADVGQFMLLVFTHDGAPIWEVRRRATEPNSSRNELVASGGADTLEAAKAAALFEAKALSPSSE